MLDSFRLLFSTPPSNFYTALQRACVAISILFLAGSFSRAGAQQRVRLTDISIEGERTADPKTLILSTGFSAGEEITVPSEKLQSAIKQLWSRGLFSDVSASLEDVRATDSLATARLAFHVREFSRLDTLIIEGVDELSLENVKKKILFFRGAVVRPSDVLAAKNEIIKLYNEEGYLAADVETKTKITDTAKGRIALTFVVNEGRDARIRSITFNGNTHVSASTLKGEMEETKETRWWKIFTGGKFNRKKFEEDKTKIIAYYKKNGFRDAEILSDSVWFDSSKTKLFVAMNITEGPQYFIRSVNVTGNTVYPTDLLLHRLAVKPGDVYNAETVEQNVRGNQDQNDIASLYFDNGYLGFNAQINETRSQGDSLELTVVLTEREQFYVGRVAIEGNSKTQEKIIRRELFVRPGDVYNRGAIIRSIKQLAALQYFNQEKLFKGLNQKPVDNKTVDLSVEVEEKSSDTFNAQVGFSGSFGVTGSLGLSFNNFDIAAPLSGGAGQIMNFQWDFGGAAQNFRTFSLGFTEPWLFGHPTTVGGQIFDTHQNYAAFDLRSTGLAANIGRRFRFPDDYFRGDWRMSITRNDVAQSSTSIYRSGVTTEVSVTQKISRSSIGNPIFPTDGSRFSITTTVAGGTILGNTDFYKNDLSLDFFTPLLSVAGMERLTLMTSFAVGHLSGFTSNSYIPPIEYYFMGGNGLASGFGVTTPLRGYDDRQILPPDRLPGSTEGQQGGKTMLKYGAELRFALALEPIPIYVLAFAEAGNVWAALRTADPFTLKRATGIGARFLVNPIGLIGFDYGYGFDPVGKVGEPSGWHFHFQFGKSL